MKKSYPIGLFPLFTVDIKEEETFNFSFIKLKKQIINAARTELTIKQWEIFKMHYFEKKTQKEIAFLIGVDKSSVCRQLRRSREKLNKVFRYSSFSQMLYGAQPRLTDTFPKA